MRASLQQRTQRACLLSGGSAPRGCPWRGEGASSLGGAASADRPSACRHRCAAFSGSSSNHGGSQPAAPAVSPMPTHSSTPRAATYATTATTSASGRADATTTTHSPAPSPSTRASPPYPGISSPPSETACSAVVSTLIGRPKLPTLQPSCHSVPLLLPSEHGLPFSVTLDLSTPPSGVHTSTPSSHSQSCSCLQASTAAAKAPCACNGDHLLGVDFSRFQQQQQQQQQAQAWQQAQQQLIKHGQDEEAATLSPTSGPSPHAPSGHLPSLPILPSTSHSPPECSEHDSLELLYVLSGEGLLLGRDGSRRGVRPGDSVLAWGGTTQLVATPAMPTTMQLAAAAEESTTMQLVATPVESTTMQLGATPVESTTMQLVATPAESTTMQLAAAAAESTTTQLGATPAVPTTMQLCATPAVPTTMQLGAAPEVPTTAALAGVQQQAEAARAQAAAPGAGAVRVRAAGTEAGAGAGAGFRADAQVESGPSVEAHAELEPLAVLRFHVPLHLLQPFAAPSHPPSTPHSTLPAQPALLPTPSTPSHTPADLSSHNNVVAWPGRRRRTSPVPEASRQLPATSAAAPPVPRVQYRPKGNSGNSPSNNASNSLGAVAAAALAAGNSTPLGLSPPLGPAPSPLARSPLPVAPAPFPVAPPPSPLAPVPPLYTSDLSGQPDQPLRLGAGECGRIMSTAKVRARSAVKRMTAAQPKEQQGKGSSGGSTGSDSGGSSSSSSSSDSMGSSSRVGNNASSGSSGGGSSGSSGSSRHGGVAATSSCVLMQRAMEEFQAYMFPHQTNKLAFVFDPSELDLPLSFGVEVFESGHHTPIHVHTQAHELFFVLAGTGDAYCDGHRLSVGPGDVIVFPPGSKHGLDNNSPGKLYCLQLMAPNQQFVEHVKTGTHVGRLDDEDLCNLTNTHC